MTDQPRPSSDEPGSLPLNYASGDAQSNDALARKSRVWHGLAAGFLLSLLWWLVGVGSFFRMNMGQAAFWTIIVLVAIKLIASVVAICFPRWRRFGIGLLLSMGLFALIFFGTCFAILAWH